MSQAYGKLFLLGLLAAGFVVGPILFPFVVPPALSGRVADFGAYWSAAKVASSGGNPYNAESLRSLEKAIDPKQSEPIITWSPPWAVTLVLPLSKVDFPAARWNWMLFQLVGLAGCSAVIWILYGGHRDRVGVAWLLSFTFYPTLQLIALGQMSLFTLAAVVGFLAGVRTRPFLAGASLALVLVKPHNVIPLGVAVLFWVAFRFQWRVIAGGVVAVLVWTVIALAINPSFFDHYHEAMTRNPPGKMVPPTVGTLLRIAFGADQLLIVQFIPTVIGAAWAVWYSIRFRKTWDWLTATPALLFASVLCSPYGWVYDSVVLLVPILSVAARGVRWPGLWLVGYFITTGFCVSGYVRGWEEVTFVWLPLLVYAVWILVAHDAPLNPNTAPLLSTNPGVTNSGPVENKGEVGEN